VFTCVVEAGIRIAKVRRAQDFLNFYAITLLVRTEHPIDRTRVPTHAANFNASRTDFRVALRRPFRILLLSAPDFCCCWIQLTYEIGEAVANYATRSSVIFRVAPRWIWISLLPSFTLSVALPNSPPFKIPSSLFHVPLKSRSQQRTESP